MASPGSSKWTRSGASTGWASRRRRVGGLLSTHDIDLVSLALAPDSTAIVLVAEDRWAEPLSAAARQSGGEVLAGERIPRVASRPPSPDYAGRDVINVERTQTSRDRIPDLLTRPPRLARWQVGHTVAPSARRSRAAVGGAGRPARQRAPVARGVRAPEAEGAQRVVRADGDARTHRRLATLRIPARVLLKRAVPMRMPRAIVKTVPIAAVKSSGPSGESVPTISVTPISPAAPGTSNQNAGRNVTIDGGPHDCVLIHSTTGVIANAPKNATDVGPEQRCAGELTGVGDDEHGEDREQRAPRRTVVQVVAEREHHEPDPRRPWLRGGRTDGRGGGRRAHRRARRRQRSRTPSGRGRPFPGRAARSR